MKKTAVIGAGISGLAYSQLNKDKRDITVFEASDRPGGLIRCRRIDGNLFHTTGGHVFNTKRKDVLDYFWSVFDRDNEFVKADRNATIILGDGTKVGYPIENHVYQLDDDTLKAFADDLAVMALGHANEPNNFAEFLRQRFGPTLYDLYFAPYNYKVWRRDLSAVPLSWLEGKLPMPTVSEMIYNNIRQVKEKKFVHSSFYYPKHDGSQFIADRFSQGLDIRYNTPIESIIRTSGHWIVDGQQFDEVIFTGNVKTLPKILSGDVDISGFAPALDALESHGTTAVFCEIDKNPYSWIYLPSPDYEAHRIICTGNFAQSNNQGPRLTATVEFTDAISEDAIKDNLSRMPLAPKYITHHHSQCTYPIQSADTRQVISSLKDVLKAHGMHLLGRFAEWEYYNMDVAIGAAMDL